MASKWRISEELIQQSFTMLPPSRGLLAVVVMTVGIGRKVVTIVLCKWALHSALWKHPSHIIWHINGRLRNCVCKKESTYLSTFFWAHEEMVSLWLPCPQVNLLHDFFQWHLQGFDEFELSFDVLCYSFQQYADLKHLKDNSYWRMPILYVPSSDWRYA